MDLCVDCNLLFAELESMIFDLVFQQLFRQSLINARWTTGIAEIWFVALNQKE